MWVCVCVCVCKNRGRRMSKIPLTRECKMMLGFAFTWLDPYHFGQLYNLYFLAA